MKRCKLEAQVQCIPSLRHVLSVSRYGSGFGSVSGSVIRIAIKKINYLFTGQPSPKISHHKIRSEVSAQLASRQTDRQRNNDDDGSTLAEVINDVKTREREREREDLFAKHEVQGRSNVFCFGGTSNDMGRL